MTQPYMEKRVLSIQSQVSSGYVGNNAAKLCLQINGYEVDTINTVSFSNHKGYGYWTGEALSCSRFLEIVDGLEKNNLLHYTHILTGFIPNEQLLYEISDLIMKLKLENPKIVYVCDPVLGDNDRYYVPECMVDAFKEKLLPIADIICPNQFEAQWLTGAIISDKSDALNCLMLLHDLGPKTVVITSITDDNGLTCYASTQKGDLFTTFSHSFNKFNFSFVGTGDCCAALLLISIDLYGELKVAITRSMELMSSILQETINKYNHLSRDDKMNESFKKELALVKCLEFLKFNAH